MSLTQASTFLARSATVSALLMLSPPSRNTYIYFAFRPASSVHGNWHIVVDTSPNVQPYILYRHHQMPSSQACRQPVAVQQRHLQQNDLPEVRANHLNYTRHTFHLTT